MKIMQRLFVIITVLLLTACTTSEFKPASTHLRALSTGETRLVGIQMPEIVREDLPYDVILTIDSEEKPQVNKVCFRWVAEEISSISPSLFCYSMDGDLGVGSPCSPRTSQGTTTESPSFCVATPDINYDIPGKLVVRIRPTSLKPTYNKLEGQIEYVSDGQTRLTNALRTSVSVE